jgi:REP element-mobilizing transposase RayT
MPRVRVFHIALLMGYARKNLISLQDTPYYHCVARCVRRAWLWGKDEYAGRDYSHRKKWVIDRLAELAEIFAIEICAYAVMSNHYHLVVFVDREKAKRWTQEEVIRRWSRVHQPPPLIQRYREPDVLASEREAAQKIIETWRERLFDISWFMRHLNEHLARRANAEDQCTGRFWEGRFKSQALLDEAGLLTAMAYVDLNPIRAGIVNTPEQSEFTSIYQRIRGVHPLPSQASTNNESSVRLRRFADEAQTRNKSIPYTLLDYLQLVDWSGRAIRKDKHGHIGASIPPILSRLSIDPEVWQLAMARKGTVFGRAMGRLDLMRLHAATLGQEWIRGVRAAQRIYAR